MGVFHSSQYFPLVAADLGPVAQEVMEHFRHQDYETSGAPTMSGGWHISLHKGGLFKAVLGMKTALNIEIEPSGAGTQVKAGVGIFGAQAVPSMITLFVAWPVVLTQIWGLVQNAKLDHEAMRCVEESLRSHAGPAVAVSAALGRFCTHCGATVSGAAKFCAECGTKVA
jgi:hypothetical protein